MKTVEEIKKQIKGIDWFISNYEKQVSFYTKEEFDAAKAIGYLAKIKELQAEKSILKWVLGEEQHFDDVATVGNTDVSEILHSIDNYFDQADSSKTQRQADNLIAEIYEKLSGEVKQEFQVDWSQAPEDAFEWKMVGDNEAAWVSFHAGEFYLEDAPNFNYQGAWQDSLRKRPKDNNHG